MNAREIEKYSSAITLSDMEIFVFPELIYSLVLANIMSPVIWEWRNEDCFKKLEGKSPYKKLLRLKQFIMDEFEFNLDLNTWGLTRQDVELKRFEEFIPPAEIARSNALFGYEGDKYYFNVDIRRHFGLDEYDGDIIPYWKTETIEAMNAFSLKDGYQTGAGECVSLSTLYAAAAFIVCGIPLEDIYLILTPLHSQNFIDLQDGILTNNRRILTKTMWFNGTAISDKAQRALRNEQITTVSHSSGFNHCLYKDATIAKDSYEHFAGKISEYLSTKLDSLVLANFLRSHHQYQRYFQFCRKRRGESMFVKAEVLFHYEHGSSFRIADASFDKLLGEVSHEDYSSGKIGSRLCCEQLMAFAEYENIDLGNEVSVKTLSEYIKAFVPETNKLIEELKKFTHVDPNLPGGEKNYISNCPIEISPESSREEIIEYLATIREKNITADLAFYAYRDMDKCDWEPFIKAGIERNPVSIEAFEGKSIDEAYRLLSSMSDDSIYDGNRVAQPDEVINFNTGDGIEKAVLLANIIRSRNAEQNIEITVDSSEVVLTAEKEYHFNSKKTLVKKLSID